MISVVFTTLLTNCRSVVFNTLLINSQILHGILLDLPGVEVIGQTSLVITSSAQTFQWTGYGFKLHVPEDSLPVDVDSCVLHIYASISGQYQFPGNQELVSAVYWVRCEPPCRFKQQLTAEFQHCAKKAYSNMLTFVRAVCSQKTLPYAFIKVEGCGTFTDQSSYGIIQLDHFSGYAVTGDSPIERMYTASLYYLGRGICSWEIHLVVTWDDEPHVTVSKYLYYYTSDIWDRLCNNKDHFVVLTELRVVVGKKAL